MYKHTDEEREEKEESRVEGNHVRKVVKPMEARINGKMEKMKEEMKSEMQEMKTKMGNMEAKMDRILTLLERR